MGTIKNIEINAKQWFDKINGNSYFAGNIFVEFTNGKIDEILMPFKYGYGEQYEQEAKALLTEFNYISTDWAKNLTRYCRENNITLNKKLKSNCLKRELMAFKIQYNNRITEIRAELA